jgi:hypothetical protein
MTISFGSDLGGVSNPLLGNPFRLQAESKPL